MKAVLAVIAAVVMAQAMSADAWAAGKRKLRPQLTPQVLATAQKNSLDMALLKFRAQIRQQRVTAAIKF